MPGTIVAGAARICRSAPTEGGERGSWEESDSVK